MRASLPRPPLRSGAFATLGAMVGSLALYLLAGAAGDRLLVGTPGRATRVALASVLVMSALGALVASGVAALAARWPRPRAAFLAVTVAGLALSLTGPLAQAPLHSALWLASMHVVVGGTALIALGRPLPSRQPRPSRALSPAGV